MKHWIIAAAALTAGCAAFAPPEPCSTDWFAAEAKAAFVPVRGEMRDALNQLRSTQSALKADDPGLGAAVRLAFALQSGVSLIEALQQDAVPRLESAAATCDDPAFIRRAVFAFLEQEGVDDFFSGGASTLDLSGSLDVLLGDEGR